MDNRLMKKNTVFFTLTCSLFMLATVLMSQTKKPAAAAKPAAKGGLQASITRGKQVYLAQCLACHQADAIGVQGLDTQMHKTTIVLVDKATLVKIVLNR